MKMVLGKHLAPTLLEYNPKQEPSECLYKLIKSLFLDPKYLEPLFSFQGLEPLWKMPTYHCTFFKPGQILVNDQFFKKIQPLDLGHGWYPVNQLEFLWNTFP